jgi:hypothetical protein
MEKVGLFSSSALFPKNSRLALMGKVGLFHRLQFFLKILDLP